MTPKGPRAAIYVRLSRDRVGETSTARQEADTRALSQARGFDVVEVFSDVDLSAYKAGVVRPAYEKMLAAARAGELDAVVVWKVDRLARSLREFVRVTEMLDKFGVALVSVNESLDTSSPMGRAMLQIIGVFAELESATISLRTKNAKAHDAAHGRPNGGGRRAFGYTTQTFDELVPEEVELLREAAERVLAGDSLRSVAADWNARGLTTVTGAAWTSSNLGRTLRSEHLAGRRRHGGQVVDGEWPVVFSAEEHEALRLAAGEHRDAAVARHLLTGLLRCGPCGARMRAKTTRRFGFQYACQVAGCSRVTVKGSTLEDVIAEAVLLRLDSQELRAALAVKEDSAATRRLADELADDRAALEQLSRDHYVTRVVSRDVFLAAAGELEERIRTAEERLSRQQPAGLPEGTPLRDGWHTGGLEFRRAVLSAVVEKISIAPATVRGRSTFDPERVDVTWRV